MYCKKIQEVQKYMMKTASQTLVTQFCPEAANEVSLLIRGLEKIFVNVHSRR